MQLDNSQLQLVKDRIAVGKAYVAEEFTKKRRPEVMKLWYEGRHYDAKTPLGTMNIPDKIVVNYSMVNVLVKLASLSYGEPDFRVVPRRKQLSESARTFSEALNYEWRAMKAHRVRKRSALDVRVLGTGVLGVDWVVETARGLYAPGVTGGDLGVDLEAEMLLNIPSPLVYDNPMIRRVQPDWILLDPDSGDDWTRGWFAGEVWQRPLIQVRNDPRFGSVAKKLKGKIVSPYAKDAGYDESKQSANKDENLRLVEGVRIYLRDLGVVVEWCDEKPDEPLFVGDLGTGHFPMTPDRRPYYPYVVMANTMSTGSHFGISDIQRTETQQMELDLGRSQLAMARRQNATQYWAREGVFKGDTKSDIQRGIANAIHEIEPSSASNPIDTDFGMLPRGPLQAEVYASIEAAKGDMTELSGVSAYQRGVPPPGVEFATEAALIQQGAGGLREAEQKQEEEWMAEAGQIVAWLLQRYAHRPRSVPVISGQGEEETIDWQEWDRESIQGDFDFMVEPGSMTPPNAMIEEQKWFGRLQGALQVAGANGMADPRPILRAWLNSFDFPDVEAVMAGLPMPPMGPGAGMPGVEGATGGPEGIEGGAEEAPEGEAGGPLGGLFVPGL